MSFILRISKKAREVFYSLPGKEQKRILQKMGDFEQWIEGEHISLDVKMLRGTWEGCYRIRLGRMRIILIVDDMRELISIERIGFRGHVYK